jgi:hypothetical protein
MRFTSHSSANPKPWYIHIQQEFRLLHVHSGKPGTSTRDDNSRVQV